MGQVKEQSQDQVEAFMKVVEGWEPSQCLDFIRELLLTHPELMNDIDQTNGFIKI